MQSLKIWRLIWRESASEYDYFAAQEVMKVNLLQSSGCSIVYFGFPADRLRNRKNEDTVASTLGRFIRGKIRRGLDNPRLT